jgi:hypothetical protein
VYVTFRRSFSKMINVNRRLSWSNIVYVTFRRSFSKSLSVRMGICAFEALGEEST